MIPLLLLGLIACGSGDEGESGDPLDPSSRPTEFGGDRPVTLQTPDHFEDGATYPLVLILHGYSATGLLQQLFLGLGDLSTSESMFVLAPDGTVDAQGRRFWNADPMCCDFGNTGVDDVAYLTGLINDVKASWPVDPDRIQIIAHSNGHFMAYRLACEHPELVTAIAGLAGRAASNPSTCNPSQPVHVLHIHGTNDQTITYENTGYGPSAVESVEQWAGHVGCTGARSGSERLDLDSSLAGDETTVEAYAGCPSDGAVELWTLEGGGHVPQFSANFRPEVLAWLAAHPR